MIGREPQWPCVLGSDWPCVLGPADSPPGGIWIGFIRRTAKHKQSIVAVTGWENSDMQKYDMMDIAEWYPNTMDCLQPEEGNCLLYAVCYDSVVLMPLIRTNRVLFSDGDGTANRTGYDRDDDGSPAGLLDYLPRRLYWPWSLHGMTQCQAKIKGSVVYILKRVILDDGGLWDIRISVTPPATHAGKGLSPAVIGRRASVAVCSGL